MIRYIFFSIFLLFTLDLQVLSKELIQNPFCEGNNLQFQEKNFLNFDSKNIDFNKLDIEIRTVNRKKWARSILELYMSATSNTSFIPQKYKKKFKSLIYVTYRENKKIKIKCKFHGKINIHGNLIDHISPTNEGSSIHVKLADGNIFGITEFKLFKPETRGAENEVVSSIIMREMNFLSPRTSLIQVKVNGKKNLFIFQEHINKEFLEFSNRQESVILKSDERFIFTSDDSLASLPTLARVDNFKWSIKSKSNFFKSIKALGRINEFYISNSAYKKFGKNKQFGTYLLLVSHPYFKSLKNVTQHFEFETMLMALDAGHGLSLDDRVYYYDIHLDEISPIYYEGGSVRIWPSKKNYLNKYNNTYRTPVYLEHKNAAQNLKKRIINLDVKNLIKKIQLSGIKISEEKTEKLINFIYERLENIEYYEIDDLSLNEFYEQLRIKNHLFYYYKNTDFKLVFHNSNDIFDVCDFNLNCSQMAIFKENSKHLFNKDKKSKYLFIGSNLNNYKKYQSNNKKDGEKTILKLDDSKLFLFKNEAKINREKKTITIYPNHLSENILIKDGTLKDWTIKYINNSSNVFFDKSNSVKFLGCLNFVDVNVENIDIEIINPLCEDGVNFVRSQGKINNLEIYDAASDGLDADFSEIYIENIKIINSKNDCIDFSYGKYFIKKGFFSYCGDKAISVGENSKFFSEAIKIENVNNGLISKDSSYSNVENIEFKNIKNHCFAAYRKKQEFMGSKIFINNLTSGKSDCKNKQFSQIGSKIEINGNNEL